MVYSATNCRLLAVPPAFQQILERFAHDSFAAAARHRAQTVEFGAIFVDQLLAQEFLPAAVMPVANHWCNMGNHRIYCFPTLSCRASLPHRLFDSVEICYSTPTPDARQTLRWGATFAIFCRRAVGDVCNFHRSLKATKETVSHRTSVSFVTLKPQKPQNRPAHAELLWLQDPADSGAFAC